MIDWYFKLSMEELDEALMPFLEEEMNLKQWDAFHKKMHHAMSVTPQPQDFNLSNNK